MNWSAAGSSLLDLVTRLPLPDAIMKGTILLLLAFGSAVLLRRASAASRHLVWSLGLVGLLAVPILSATLPWRLEVLPLPPAAPNETAAMPARFDAPSAERSSFDVGVANPVGELAPLARTNARPTSAERSPSASPTVAPPVDDAVFERVTSRASWMNASTVALVLAAVWLAGVVAVLGRLLIGALIVRWLASRAKPMSDPSWSELVLEVSERLAAEGELRVLQSARSTMPFACGVLRPTIVLPASADEWAPSRRVAVLLHEVAHIQRRDIATNLIAQTVCALYWFHPLVWMAARRLRAESERACDDLVLRSGTRASEYADHLLQIVRAAGRSYTPAAALAMAKRSDFEGRLIAILEPGVRRHRLTGRRTLAITTAFAISAIPIAAIGPARAEVAPPQPLRGTVYDAPGYGDEWTSSGSSTAQENVDTGRAGRDRNRQRDRFVDASVDEGAKYIEQDLGDSPQVQQGQGRAARQTDLAIQGLVAAMRDSELAVRLAAVKAIGAFEDASAVEPLALAMRDESAEVRYAAAQSLGEIQDPRAIAALSDALRNDSDARVRETAAWALGEIEDRRAVPALTAALRTEREAPVRVKIVWALGEIEDPRAVDAIAAVLRDNEVEVRRMAVWALGEIESPEAVPALTPLLRDDDPAVRRQAAWALGEIESPSSIQALSAAVQDRDAGVREMVVWALGEIEDARALPALTSAMRDAQVTVRRKAAWAIGEIDDMRSAPQALIDALKDDDREVKRAAAHALGEIGDPAAAPALAPLARNADDEVRKVAVYALAEIGGVEAMEVLVALLKDSDPEIRRMAAQALGKNR